MKILAFETSCDDTAVAVVENGTKVLASARTGQPEHSAYGGVVPEIAARLHAEHWIPTLKKCLADSGFKISEIDAVAVTNGPGLQTSLLTGTTAASFLAQFFNKKIIPVQHIRGHINSIFLERDISKIKFPVLVLTVSGGHTELFSQKSPTEISPLGSTLDDAAGEAFDKCAKMLGLGYPGGPIVSDFAKNGNREAFKFPRPLLEKNSLDFSFSGIKAAIYREVKSPQPPFKKGENFSEEFISNVCASFEAAVTDVFLKKIARSLDQFPEICALHFTGGVSANEFLRENLQQFCKKNQLEFRVPKKFEYCTDNAAMIAGEAFWQFQKNSNVAVRDFVDAQPRMEI